MAAEIVHDDDIAGLERWNELLLDVGAEAFAVDRAVEDAWAVRRSQRSAPRKVRVRQRPCGAKPRSRSPLGPHPRSGAMLVLIQVSSMKTRRFGSRLACHARQRRRRRAMSERACSSANSVFLKRSPSRRRNSQTALCETRTPRAASSSLSPYSRQVRGLLDPLQDKGAMRIKQWFAMSAHLAGGNRSGRPVALRPLHHRGNRNAKPQSHRAAALAAQNRRNHALAKIVGKRSGHAMLAPIPANILNHKTRFDGIPPDSLKP